MKNLSMTDLPYLVAAKIDVATAAIDNPMDGIVPNFSAFGVEFDSLWKKLLAGFWGLALIIIVGFLAVSFVTMLTASGGDPRKVKDSKAGVTNALLALAGCAALPVIVGGILYVVS